MYLLPSGHQTSVGKCPCMSAYSVESFFGLACLCMLTNPPCWHMPACGTVHGCITKCTYVNVHTSQQTSSKSIHRNCHRPERAMHALAQCSVHCPSPPLGPACSSFFLKFLSSCKPFPPFTPSLPTVLALQHLNSTGSQILTQLSPRPVWDFSLQAPWMVLGKQLVPLDIGI